jgi:hypothetical protein
MQGSINDDLILLSSGIFILGLAGLEYSIGIILLLIFKNINKKMDFDETNNDIHSYNILKNNNLYVNRYIWNYSI